MHVIGRGLTEAQNAAAANGRRDVALLAGPVGVMLVRYQMLEQICRVADGISHQNVKKKKLDETIPEHVCT